MAIAFDTATVDNASGTSLTFSHTCTGSNRFLIIGVFSDGASGGDVVSGVTYAGVALTRANTQNSAAGGNRLYTYYLVAPATGANNVVISTSSSVSISGFAQSYTGVAQSSPIDDSETMADTNTTATLSFTSTVANDWGFMLAVNQTNGNTNSTGTNYAFRLRRTGATPNNFQQSGDTNGSLGSAGAETMTVAASSGTPTLTAVGVIFKEFTASGPVGVKTLNGIAAASIKTWNGIPWASVKSWNGIT